MDVALSTISLPSLPWKACLAEASEAGYRNVELMMLPGFAQARLDEIRPRELVAEAARRRVAIIGLHAGALDGLSDTTIHETLGYVKRVIAFAREAEVPLVNVNGGYLPPAGHYGPDDRIRFIHRIIAALRELEPLLAKSGRRLTLENHFRFQLETAEDYQEIFNGLPEAERISFTVDTGHFTAAKVDMPAFIARFGRRVSHVHIKDHIGEQSMPLGQGRTDNHAVVRALAQLGYAGCLSVELEVHDQREIDHVRAARLYMDSLLGDCGVPPKEWPSGPLVSPGRNYPGHRP